MTPGKKPDKLESLRERREGSKGLCRICGKRPSVAILSVNIRRVALEGKSGGGPTIAGHQKSVCEACALEVWPQMRDLLP